MKVPKLDSFSVNNAALPQARLSAPNIVDYRGQQTEEMGNALMQAGGTMSKIIANQQEQADRVRINAAMNDAQRARLKLTHDKDVGYSNLKGESALNRPDGKSLDEEYGQKYDDSIKSITEGLGNDRQKQAFKAQADNLGVQFRGQIQDHVGTEYNKYQAGVQIGSIELATQQASLDWNKPEVISESVKNNLSATAELGRLKGEPANVTAMNQLENVASLHHGVVQSAVDNGDNDYAKAYLGKYKEQMTDKARHSAESMIKSSDNIEKAQAFADQVMSKGMSISDALGQVETKFAGQDERLVKQEIISRYNQKEAADIDRKKEQFSSGLSEMMQSGSLSPSTRSRLMSENPEALTRIDSWKHQEEQRALRDASGEATSDPETYYALRTLAIQNPAAFSDVKSTNLLEYKSKLSKEQFNNLVNIQTSINKSDALQTQTDKMVKATLTNVKQDIKAAGINLNAKPGSAPAKEAEKFMGALTEAIDTANANSIASGKGSIKPEEAKLIAMGMVREGVEQGSGIFGAFQTKKKGYQMDDPGKFVSARYNDIPVNIRDSLTNSYRSKFGVSGDLTEEQESQIEKAYTNGKQKGRF